jgi:putative spermidine/putrescine transport system permease protein
LTERPAEEAMTESIVASGANVAVREPSALPAKARRRTARLTTALAPYLQAAPLAVILTVFLLIPIVTIVVVSFWDYDSVRLIPGFVLDNYTDALGDPTTWRTYLSTMRFAALTWAFTLAIGFMVAYFLAFHVTTPLWQTVLFLVCTIPFLTSNIIRMISWIPFLGRNGLMNQALQAMGVTDHPLEFLLFSNFSVVLTFVHLYTLFMVTPIFNTMMRIDRSLLEAARDAGAGGWAVLREVIVPLSLPGIAIGSIFVVTLVMGDFITVRLMSGGQSASIGMVIANSMGLLQYPAAAAHAVVLLLIVLGIVWAILRVVDIRREL